MVGVIGLCLAGTGVLRAGDAPALDKIIAKGIKAQGGAEPLGKFKNVTFKDKGTFYGKGDQKPYTGEFSLQDHKQFRMSMDMKEQGKDLQVLFIVNGPKGWMKVTFDGKAVVNKALPKDELAELHESLYAGWVVTLLPLKDKAFKLSPLGEVQVGGKAAVGVRVEHKGHRDVNLFFDKETGLLVKSETQIKDIEAGGKEMLQETFYKDYKTFDGAKQPTRVTIHRDGKRYVESEATDYRPAESLDASLFAEP
jgi:hypothetical protein